jgi:Rrf2 family protein
MLNQSAEYALRAATRLAALGPDESMHARELADALGIPANYLSKLLHQLAVVGILESRRGRSGGFRLARPADEITLEAVVAPFEDVTRYRHCLLGKAVCSDSRPCAAHTRWRPVGRLMTSFLTRTTLADVGQRPVRIARR